ncbi:MAG TPA: hypothetical protein VGP52_06315 [Stellaceae bacterium]|nr:hypothetical protein [Stellaceae bacterium]
MPSANSSHARPGDFTTGPRVPVIAAAVATAGVVAGSFCSG